MGMKARKQPPRAVGHRCEYVQADYDHYRNTFEARQWSDDLEELQAGVVGELAQGPGVTELVMERADFEAREAEGRAVDPCAPGSMPGRG